MADNQRLHIPTARDRQTEQLKELIAKWRESIAVHLQNARRQRAAGFPELADDSLSRAEVLQQYADELDSLLSVSPQRTDPKVIEEIRAAILACDRWNSDRAHEQATWGNSESTADRVVHRAVAALRLAFNRLNPDSEPEPLQRTRTEEDKT